MNKNGSVSESKMRSFILFLLTLALSAVAVALFQVGSAARQIGSDIEKVEGDVAKVEADIHGVQGDVDTIVKILGPIEAAVQEFDEVWKRLPKVSDAFKNLPSPPDPKTVIDTLKKAAADPLHPPPPPLPLPDPRSILPHH